MTSRPRQAKPQSWRGPDPPPPDASARGSRLRPGFTLLEMTVVVVILAVLSLAVFQGFRGLTYDRKTRVEASRLETLLTAARSRAGALQIPVRVVVDCAKAAGDRCRYSTQRARVSGSRVVGWAAPQDVHQVDRVVNIELRSGEKFESDGSTPLTGVYWTIFLPGREALTSPRPFDLVFFFGNDWNVGEAGYRVRVANKSGRVSFMKNEPTGGGGA
ncbi:MAG: prepilin-type N-terminal cleavage/methylation domain-containing protein [Deltaproteobacteria bacterium]|nr:prepilin-type N-terminal cleavage/methylation domain-containing protein [Deltaproteobacteria bacterium]